MKTFRNGIRVRALMDIISLNLNSHWHFTLESVSSTNNATSIRYFQTKWKFSTTHNTIERTTTTTTATKYEDWKSGSKRQYCIGFVKFYQFNHEFNGKQKTNELHSLSIHSRCRLLFVVFRIKTVWNFSRLQK